MTTARNPITGALIRTKNDSAAYRNNFDAVFGNKKPVPEAQPEPEKKEDKKQ